MSKQPTNKPIKSLNEFIDIIKDICSKGGDLSKFIFRGQANESWPVDSGVVRRLRDAKLKSGHRNVTITEHEIACYLEECLEEARKRENTHPIIKGMSDIRLLAEMQHYGAATQLIDFSYNSLIALYMATSDNMGKNGCNGKVFCINYNKKFEFNEIVNHKELSETEKPTSIKEILKEPDDKIKMYRPYHSNTRIIKQESLFVFSSKGVIEPDKIDFEFIIDKNSKGKILKDLNDIAGLSEEAVYPDFLGYLQANNSRRDYKMKKAIYYFQLGNALRLHTAKESDRVENMAKAIEHYTKAIDLDGTQSQPYFERGYLYYKYFKKYPEAIDSFSAAIRLSKKDAAAWFNRANAYYDKWLTENHPEDLKKAKIDYKTSIRLDESNIMAINNLADLLNNAESYAEAKTLFKKGLSIDSEDSDLWFGLGEVYFAQGNYPMALAKFRKALQLDDKDHSAAFNIGLCLLNLSDLPKAEEFLLLSFKLNEENSDACHHLGQIYFKRNRIAKAHSFFSKSIDLSKSNAEAFNNMGFCQLRMGKLEDAEKNIRKGIDLGRKDFGYKNLGHHYLCNGNEEKALECYRLSIQEFNSKREFFSEFANDYNDLKLQKYKISFLKYKDIQKQI